MNETEKESTNRHILVDPLDTSNSNDVVYAGTPEKQTLGKFHFQLNLP